MDSLSPAKTITLDTLVGTTYRSARAWRRGIQARRKTFRIEPVLEDPAVAKLFFILRDTPAPGRHIRLPLLYTGFPPTASTNPANSSRFNRMENPPCGIHTFFHCPLPPPGNRLPIALPVGEKRYHE